jgi:hypothetical protein
MIQRIIKRQILKLIEGRQHKKKKKDRLCSMSKRKIKLNGRLQLSLKDNKKKKMNSIIQKVV